MTEERYRLHDSLAKWLTLILAVGGFGIALFTYIAQQEAARNQNAQFEQSRVELAEKEAKDRREEYKRRVWERQLELYFQACKAASTISTVESGKDPEYGPARLRFEQLYNGELCVVESPTVSTLMVDFRRALLAYEKNPAADSRERLRMLSIKLAQACRMSIESRWKVDLGEAQEKQ